MRKRTRRAQRPYGRAVIITSQRTARRASRRPWRGARLRARDRGWRGRRRRSVDSGRPGARRAPGRRLDPEPRKVAGITSQAEPEAGMARRAARSDRRRRRPPSTRCEGVVGPTGGPKKAVDDTDWSTPRKNAGRRPTYSPNDAARAGLSLCALTVAQSRRTASPGFRRAVKTCTMALDVDPRPGSVHARAASCCDCPSRFRPRNDGRDKRITSSKPAPVVASRPPAPVLTLPKKAH